MFPLKRWVFDFPKTKSSKMILLKFFIVFIVESLPINRSGHKNPHDQPIKFKPNQDLKIHIFVSMNMSRPHRLYYIRL